MTHLFRLTILAIAFAADLLSRLFVSIGAFVLGLGNTRKARTLLAVAVFMAAVSANAGLKIAAATRNAELDAITTAIGSSGVIKLYDGSRPATCGTATTLLGTMALSATAAPGASAGVLTFSAITNDSSADATSTATWFRVQTSGGTCILDGTAGTSATDMILNTAAIVTGAAISVSSFTITAGNA